MNVLRMAIDRTDQRSIRFKSSQAAGVTFLQPAREEISGGGEAEQRSPDAGEVGAADRQAPEIDGGDRPATDEECRRHRPQRLAPVPEELPQDEDFTHGEQSDPQPGKREVVSEWFQQVEEDNKRACSPDNHAQDGEGTPWGVSLGVCMRRLITPCSFHIPNQHT